MKPIKVLHIIDYLQTTGGAEKRLLNDLELIDNKTIYNSVCCLFTADKEVVNKLKSKGINVYLCSENNYYKKFKYIKRLIKEIKPDIVHTQLFYSDTLGRIAAKICRVPVIISTIQSSVHEPDVKYYYLLHRRIIDIITSRLCTHIIAVSEFVKKSISKRLFINPNKISVLYNYVIKDKIKTKKEKHKDIILYCVGKINPAKGQLELINAVSNLVKQDYDIILILAGDGPLRKKCELEAKKLGIDNRVRFLGNITNVNTVLISSDAFIFPTHSEGLPLALLEAVLARKPCIVSAIQPNFEVINPENCFHFKPENIQEIEQSIKEFINTKKKDPEKIKSMINKAYKHAREKFDPEINAKKLEESYIIYKGRFGV